MSASQKRIFSSAVVIAAVLIIDVLLILAVFNHNADNTEENFAKAREYVALMDYDNSIALYNKIIAGDNCSAEAYAELADVYILKGNESKALEVLMRGIGEMGNLPLLSSKLSELFPDVNYAEYTLGYEGESAIAAVTEPVEEELIEIPDFVGLNKSEAVDKAAECNVRIKIEYEKNTEYAADIVFRQSKDAGAMVPTRTVIQLYVGSGEPKRLDDVSETDTSASDMN